MNKQKNAQNIERVERERERALFSEIGFINIILNIKNRRIGYGKVCKAKLIR